MKKILIIILILFPLIVNADLKVTNHLIDAEIEIAGALNVKELIVVEGDADYLGRTLNYYSFGNKHWDTEDKVDLDNGIFYNGQSISINTVSAYEFDGNVDFNSLEENITEKFTEFDIKNPSDKTYSFDNKKDGTGFLKIYYPIKNKKIAFYINYIVANVVVKHNDIKEINYSFNNLSLKSKETLMRVIIPYATDDEKYHVWVHGNQSGKVEELINKSEQKVGIYASFPTVKESINFRMTLPQEQVGIDMYLNNSNIDALDKIIEIENNKLNKTNISNTIINVMKYVLAVLGIGYVLGSIIFLKINNRVIFYVYLAFGIFICIFNYLFKFNYWYLYIIILFPLLIKLIKKYIVK